MSARSQRASGARTASLGGHGKYQLEVTAVDVADLVRHVGGWIYDRANAGWDVAVTVTGECDLTPLRILGVRTEWTGEGDGGDHEDTAAPPRLTAFAVAAEALATTGDLREELLRTLKRGVSEVTIWGDGGDGLGVDPVEHVLSSAAKAFKAHALRAAGVDEPVRDVETFGRRPSVFPTAVSV